jgi:predicted transcriptional regulator
MSEHTLLRLTTGIVSSYLSRHAVGCSDLPNLIHNVHGALAAVAPAPSLIQPKAAPQPSARQVRASLKPDGLVSFEDGRTYRTLKRHLIQHGLTPDQYRAKWGLSVDYPMICADLSKARSEIAKRQGLGRNLSQRRSAPTPPEERKPPVKGHHIVEGVAK